MIACSRMYDVAPGAAAAWRTLLEWTARRAGVDMTVIDHPFPAPLEDLWERTDLGCAFMCGWPWAERARPPRLLAAPVPAAPRYGGRPVYFTDFVVRDDSPYRTLADTFGGRIAYTVETSHSGWNAARHHLLRYRTPARPTLYREVRGPYISGRRVAPAVLGGEVDVGPMDSYFLDLLRRHAPDVVAGLRVIESTAPAPIPPLVAAPDADADACGRVTAALLEAHGELKPVLDELLLARFAAVSPDDYRVTRDRAREAVAAGYPRIA